MLGPTSLEVSVAAPVKLVLGLTVPEGGASRQQEEEEDGGHHVV